MFEQRPRPGPTTVWSRQDNICDLEVCTCLKCVYAGVSIAVHEGRALSQVEPPGKGNALLAQGDRRDAV